MDGAECVRVTVNIRPLITSELLVGCTDCISVVPGEPQILWSIIAQSAETTLWTSVSFCSLKVLGFRLIALSVYTFAGLCCYTMVHGSRTMWIILFQDPELALALRVSIEEERARQEAAAKRAAEDSSKQDKGGEEASNSQDATMTERASAVTCEAENKSIDFMSKLTFSVQHDDDNGLLQQALAMSMDDPASSQDFRDTDMSEAVGDDPDLAMALQMFVQEGEKDSSSDKDMSS